MKRYHIRCIDVRISHGRFHDANQEGYAVHTKLCLMKTMHGYVEWVEWVQPLNGYG